MNILIIMGTRPEAIKFAPLIKVLNNDPYFNLKVCVTGQHKQMLQQVLNFFNIKADFDLELMQTNQSLHDLSANCLLKLRAVLEGFKPEIVFVQGDTTTAFIGALAAFYLKAKIAHLEAGLRSGDIYSPFPEEANRKLISVIATYHFAPTPRAIEELRRETITKNVWMVGNSVIDALLLGMEILKSSGTDFGREFPLINFSDPLVLVTAHRRESFGEPFENICGAIAAVARERKNVQFVYPVHFNPNVRAVVNSQLSAISNVHLIEPLDYARLIWLMEKSHFVLTDSGGIQEEAPVLGKPVLVLRKVTERIEGIEAGTAKLVGVEKDEIVDSVIKLLDNFDGVYERMSKAINPYGDGSTSRRIAEILKTV